MSQPPFPGQPDPVPPSSGGQPHYPAPQPAYPGQQPTYPAQPPAYPGQPLPPPPVRPWRSYRPSKGLAVAAVAVGGVWTLVELVEATAAWFAGETYAQAARDGVPAEEVITAYDVVGILWGLIALAGYVVGCLLLSRLRENAEALSATPHTRSAGWVWGGWLVPFVSLWFPYQVVRDIRRATAPHALSTLVGWWWAAYLVSSVTTMAGTGLVPTSGTPSESDVAALGPVETIDALLVVVSFVLWCLVVLKTVAEQERAATAATASFMPPWAAGPTAPPSQQGA